jgi:hypothetical protein
MDQIYPDEGLVYAILQVLLGDAAAGMQWDLFTNDVTPTLNTVLSDLTLATTGWTNSGNLLTPSDFTLQQVTAHIGSAQAPNIAFTNMTGVDQNVYGFCVHNTAFPKKLFAVARFDSAPIVVHDGDSIPVIPIIGDYSGLTS